MRWPKQICVIRQGWGGPDGEIRWSLEIRDTDVAILWEPHQRRIYVLKPKSGPKTRRKHNRGPKARSGP
jgi:hypothetical protein